MTTIAVPAGSSLSINVTPAADGSAVAVVVVNAPPVVVPPVGKPVITKQPVGGSADRSFTLTAAATGATSQQWRLQIGNTMTPIPGATVSSHVVAQSGTYDFLALNAAGDTPSDRVDVVIAAVVPPVVVPPIDPPPVVTPPAGAVVMPKLTAGYPVAAFLAAPGGVAAALAAHGTVRLDGRTYNDAITMKAGYRLYGIPGVTQYPGAITLPDGLTDYVISGLVSANSTNITGHVTGGIFRRLTNSQINVQAGATLDSNLFLGLHGTGLDIIDADWMNNRVIFQRRQSGGPDHVDCTIHGRTRAKNYGNVLVQRTFQGMAGGGIDMSNQDDITFVTTDAEDYGKKLVNAANCGVLRWLNPQGGTFQPGASGFNVGFDDLQIFGGRFFCDPAIVGNGIKRTLLVSAGLLKQDGSPATVSGLGTKLTDASPAAALAPLLNPTRVGSPWERPALATPPDPVPGWATPPKGYKDSTAALAAAIAKDGVTLWPAGVFYVDGTITLKPNQGVIGAGDGVTVIIATKGQDIFATNFGGNRQLVVTGSVVLMDMTLYGGAYHLHCKSTGDQLSDTVLSNITFRNASVGAIGVDKIYGMDNNLFTNLNFVNCATSIKQTANPDIGERGGNVEGWVDMSYIDKTMFYACQFIGCPVGVSMIGTRTDGRDAFVSCIFRDCGSVGTFGGNNEGLYFANCDMIRSGMLQTQSPVHLASCNFSGTGPYLTGDALLEGCAFAGSGPIFANPGRVISLNCKRGGMTMAGTQLNPEGTPQLLFGAVMA